MEILATKLDGRSLDYNITDIDSQSISEIVSKMEEMVSQLPDFDTEFGLQAISIAIFGMVYQGEVVTSPFVEIDDFDLVGHFEAKYDVPVIVEMKLI